MERVSPTFAAAGNIVNPVTTSYTKRYMLTLLNE